MDDAGYRQLRAEAYRQIYRQLRDHDAAEDLVQDSLLRLFRYQGKIANIGAMVRVIAGNLIRDHVRSRARRAEEPLPAEFEIAAEEPRVDTALLHRERVGLVEDILAGMTPLRREIFLRRRLHGQSAKEVAAALGITPAAVDTHVARAVLVLHQEMKEIAQREDAA
ncbi:MAG: RNA polymerase sigma factor [Pseudomonadota bacterium]|jgi:RNA polymerase sigma-70 factor (ECF subfamily)|uniref:FIG006045: Sigma factor, ECF subfamily n=1 Tax=hydrothermal vent metagenome TaxID=652676 RepID=A0A160TM31_9ZZZZ